MTPLVATMKDEEITVLVMRCLMKCVQSFDGWRNPSEWNEIDDVIEAILKRIPFETDNRLAAIHFMFIMSITTVSMDNKPRMFQEQIDFSKFPRVLTHIEKSPDENSKLFDELRNVFASHHNLLIARWSKKLIEVFKQRTIVGKPNEIRFMLHVMSQSAANPFFP